MGVFGAGRSFQAPPQTAHKSHETQGTATLADQEEAKLGL
jgi:hypothetical protein